jgi:hypothetical protein
MIALRNKRQLRLTRALRIRLTLPKPPLAALQSLKTLSEIVREDYEQTSKI